MASINNYYLPPRTQSNVHRRRGTEGGPLANTELERPREMGWAVFFWGLLNAIWQWIFGRPFFKVDPAKNTKDDCSASENLESTTQTGVNIIRDNQIDMSQEIIIGQAKYATIKGDITVNRREELSSGSETTASDEDYKGASGDVLNEK